MKSFIPSWLLFIIFVIAIAKVYGQTSIAPKKTVEVDTLTKAPKESVPFDESFLFKLVTPTETRLRSYSIQELKRNGELKPATWKDRRSEVLYPRPKRIFYSDRRSYRSSLKFYRKQRREERKMFKKNKKQFPSITYPVFKAFPSENERKLNKKRKELFLPIDPIKPSTNYKVTLLNENNDLISSLIDVTTLVDTDIAAAEKLFNSTMESNKVPGETIFHTTFSEFQDIVTSFPLDGFTALTTLGSDLYHVFIVEENSSFDIAKAKKDSSRTSVPNSEFKVKAFSYNSSNYVAPTEFRIAFENLRDSELRPLQANSRYKIFVLYKDLKGVHQLESSDLYTYKNQVFLPPGNITAKIKAGKSSVDKLKEIDAIKTSLTAKLNAYKPVLPTTYLPLILKHLLEIDCGDPQKIVGEIFCKSKEDILKAYKAFPFLSTDNMRLLAGGVITFDKLDNETPGDDFGTRLKNIENSLSSLDKISTHLNYLIATVPAATSPDVKVLRDTLQNLTNAMKQRSIPLLTKASKIKQAVMDQLFGTQRFIRPSSFNSTTEVFEFRSRAVFRIVPDFGLIGVMKGDESLKFTDLVPYLGFNINLRPINKNIPFSALKGRRNIFNYISVMSGVTLTSIAIPNKREDLFKIGSLMTGLGFRINNTLKITSGMVWFKAFNENPLVEEKKLRFSPFVGLSLDLEIQDLFGGINKLFK